MYKAGYDAQAFISFLEKVLAQEKKRTGTISKAFATHPQTPDLHRAVARGDCNDSPSVQIKTSNFEAVKARLAALENKRQMLKEKDGNKPSFGRASAIDKNGQRQYDSAAEAA